MPSMLMFVPCVALLALAAAGQLTQQPQPARPTMPITGSVNIANRPEVIVVNAPTVEARQVGDWQVSLAGTPRIALPGPAFLQSGQAYRVTWSATGKTERYRIIVVRGDGWIEVEPADAPAGEGRRWINPAALAIIERETK